MLALAFLAPSGCLIESRGELRQWDGTTIEDLDGDGVPDDQPDNCPTTPNRSQADFDGDGVGNACDPDAAGQDVDEDGIDDSIDLCQGEEPGPNEDGDVYPSSPWQIVDECDNCPSVPNSLQLNGDGDDIGDACEAPGEPEMFANIVFFDRLRDDLMGWRILDYSRWSFASGELRADPGTIVHAVAPNGIVEKAGSRFAIETEFRVVESWDDTFWAGVILASVLNASRTALDQWHACVLAVDPGAGGEMSITLRAMGPGCSSGDCLMGEVLREETLVITFNPEATYRIYGQRDGNRLSCFVGPTADDVTGSLTMTVTSLSGGGPGLSAARARTAFLRVALYGP